MRASESELAGILARLSGSGYENCLSAVRRTGAVDGGGNVQSAALDGLAGSFHVSNASLASALSKATGSLFEDTLRNVNSGSNPLFPTYRHGWGPDK